MQLTSGSETASTWSTASSSSLILDLDYSSPNYKFEECQDHKGFPVNLFCNQCNASICGRYNSALHREHAIVPLIEIIEEERRYLAEFLQTVGKRATEAEERERDISVTSKKVEMSVSVVEQKVKEQYEYVKKELDAAYKEEMEEIKKRAEKDMRKLTEESDELHKFVEEVRDIEERGIDMLQEEECSKFIDNVSTFLQNKEAILYRDLRERNIKRIQYTEPVYKQPRKQKISAYIYENIFWASLFQAIG